MANKAQLNKVKSLIIAKKYKQAREILSSWDAKHPITQKIFVKIEELEGKEEQAQEALYKKCPFCSEEVLIDAVKCRYCQSEILSETDIKLLKTTLKHLQEREINLKRNLETTETDLQIATKKLKNTEINWAGIIIAFIITIMIDIRCLSIFLVVTVFLMILRTSSNSIAREKYQVLYDQHQHLKSKISEVKIEIKEIKSKPSLRL